MKRILFSVLALAAAIGFVDSWWPAPPPAFGQANNDNTFGTPGNATVGAVMQMCVNTAGKAVPCATAVAGTAGFPNGATPVTASGTGSTGAISATLAAAAGKNTYICGFSYQGSDATAAVAGNIAITGTVTGTMNVGYVALAAGATVPQPGPIIIPFSPCVPSSAVNTAIVVTPPTLGAGATIATVSAWGYQL
jgi:hypothetical protein